MDSQSTESLITSPCSDPTGCGVVVRQADQSVAGTGLTVGEAVSWDVVYHLVGLRWLHLH